MSHPFFLMGIVNRCIAFAVLLRGCWCPAQSSSPTLHSTSQEVLLEVDARDVKGRPVRALRREEFNVSEDGQPVDIGSFRLIQHPEKIAASAGNGPAANASRHISLVTLIFDRLNSDGRRLARQAALDLLRAQGNAYFAVFSVDQRLSLLQPFTTERSLLQAAIERGTSGTPSQFFEQSNNLKATLKTLAVDKDKELLTLSRAGADGPPPVPVDGPILAADRERAAMILSMLNFSESAARSQQGRSSIFSLTGLVGEQEHLPGIKSVIYFSEGLHVPVNLVLQFHSLIAAANRANVRVYAVDARGLTASSQTDAGRAQLAEALLSSAADMDSVVSNHGREQQNAVTPERVKAMERGEESIRADLQNTLAELAESTGGELIANSNDFRKPLERVMEDLGTYYEITYVPRIRRYDGRFHKIAVSVARPGIRLQTRDGYFALPPAEGMASHTYEVPLLLALNDARTPAFAYHAGAFHFGPAGSGVACALNVEVPLSAITFTEDKIKSLYQVHLSVVGLIKNADGEVVEKISRDVPLEGPLDKVSGFRLGTFSFVDHRVLVPGRYTLETAVMDWESEKIGTRKISFFVPSLTDGPAVSSVALIRRMEPETTATDREDPFRFDAGKVIPSLTNTIPGGTGSKLSLYFVVYPGKSVRAQPELEMELFRDAKLISRSARSLPKPQPDGSIPYIAISPVADLDPGSYQVRVIARQGAALADAHASFTLTR